MLRPEFVRRKLQLIAEDLDRLAHFRDASRAYETSSFTTTMTLTGRSFMDPSGSAWSSTMSTWGESTGL
jgi:hypothetical protein